jgi:hypothetical protein
MNTDKAVWDELIWDGPGGATIEVQERYVVFQGRF